MNTKSMIKHKKFLPFISNSQRIIGEKWLLENGRCIYKKGFNNFCWYQLAVVIKTNK